MRLLSTRFAATAAALSVVAHAELGQLKVKCPEAAGISSEVFTNGAVLNCSGEAELKISQVNFSEKHGCDDIKSLCKLEAGTGTMPTPKTGVVTPEVGNQVSDELMNALSFECHGGVESLAFRYLSKTGVAFPDYRASAKRLCAQFLAPADLGNLAANPPPVASEADDSDSTHSPSPTPHAIQRVNFTRVAFRRVKGSDTSVGLSKTVENVQNTPVAADSSSIDYVDVERDDRAEKPTEVKRGALFNNVRRNAATPKPSSAVSLIQKSQTPKPSSQVSLISERRDTAAIARDVHALLKLADKPRRRHHRCHRRCKRSVKIYMNLGGIVDKNK